MSKGERGEGAFQGKDRKEEGEERKEEGQRRLLPSLSTAVDQPATSVAAEAHVLEELVLRGASSDQAVQQRHFAKQAWKSELAKVVALKSLFAEEVQVAKAKAEEDMRRRQIQANWQGMNASVLLKLLHIF